MKRLNIKRQEIPFDLSLTSRQRRLIRDRVERLQMNELYLAAAIVAVLAISAIFI